MSRSSRRPSSRRPFGRSRPDVWPSDHERARVHAAERLSEPLSPADAAWLAEHLVTCGDCRAVATEYEAERDLLRSLPDAEPPRDLWARTAAALESEHRRALSARGQGRARAGARLPAVPLGALAGALVVAVVLGATLLSPFGSPPIASPAAPSVPASAAPAETPIAVGAQPVGFIHQDADGQFRITFAQIEQVCAASAGPDCPPLQGAGGPVLTLSEPPRSVLKSPAGSQLVVVDAATKSTGGSVFVVPAAPASPVSPAPSPPAGPIASVAGSVAPSQPASPSPSLLPTVPTLAPAVPSVSPSPTATGPLGSGEPLVSASVEPSASPTPVQPFPIIDGVIVIGESAAYSPSGQWFAFSARPADGTTGPDIYVWHVGDLRARPVTFDHRSIFSAWIGEEMLGSRIVLPEASASAPPAPDASATAVPVPTPAPTPTPLPTEPASFDPFASTAPSPSPSPIIATTASFLLDPATGWEWPMAGEGIWRPVVDPTGRYAIWWEGTIAVDPSGLDWRPADGQLVLAAWDASRVAVPPLAPDANLLPGESANPIEAASPSPSPSPSLSPSPSPSPGGSSPGPSVVPSPVASIPLTIATGPVRDWDVRWDETGTRLAVWIADPVAPDLGTLSLYTIDPATGQVDPNGALLRDEPALAGFSIGGGRLAWATPPGQGGEGSRVEVLAWLGDSAGTVQTEPALGPAPLVVIR